VKIFINALSARRGGGQTYLYHLLEKLPDNGINQVILVSPDSFKAPRNRNNIIRLYTHDIVANNPIIRVLWEFFCLPRILKKIGANVLFCPGGTVTGIIPAGCKVVTTFQNMMPFDLKQRRKYPLGYMRFRNWALKKKILRSMNRSDLVIYISEYAKNVIVKEYLVKIRKCVVIPHGIDPNFRRIPDSKLDIPAWLPDDGYFLYVSTLDVYKAQIEVITAYALLKKRRNISQKLVLIGSEYKPYGNKVRMAIADHNLKNDVIIKGAIPHDTLPSVYQNADVNIFASETENCPFILLEAMAAGRPLLVSHCQPMPEFAENSVIYFSPESPEDLANKLSVVIDNEMKLDLPNKALQQSFKYDWCRSAKETWEAIGQLKDEPNP
jgi:glycosyltransferase involved in cell wall biosynthesis